VFNWPEVTDKLLKPVHSSFMSQEVTVSGIYLRFPSHISSTQFSVITPGKVG